MKITAHLLRKVLVNSGLISQRDFSLAEKEAIGKKESLQSLIVKKGLISDAEMGQLIADKIGFPFVNLRRVRINKEILEIIPEIVAKKQKVIVFGKTKEGLKVAMHDPENLEIREFIKRKTGQDIIPYFATREDISEAIKFYKEEIKQEFKEIIRESLAEFEKTRGETRPLPVVKMVDSILDYGYENRASDIHIEPYEKKTVIRYRIDGVLHDVLTLPRVVHDFLVARVKILSRLRTDIHDAAQDGHFSFSVPEEKIDVRVSVVPIEKGEKVVMRMLTEKIRRFSLENLGLQPRELRLINLNIKKPWGMILSSGPTGCGKTTTLYAILRILNTREVNIMTIEDPIEYDIQGINQIQVNTKTNLTFSKGLRAIVRQDPNIIMVGEIRDKETAKLAINSAMTGHLVLSTFHATDAPTTLPRLLDMGIEPFLIASTINVVIAQRLVRRICPKCIETYEASFLKVKQLLGEELASRLPRTKKNRVRLFRGRGCSLCQNTGYRGRVGIFEVMEITEPIKKLIMNKANASQIRKEAIKEGMTTMIEDGLKKVEVGITTIEELLRAVR